jgi:DNA-binding CsgD family transcriptional regulator
MAKILRERCPSCAGDIVRLSALEWATLALESRPGLSDRAIAAAIGVSRETVRRARSSDTFVSVEKRESRAPGGYPMTALEHACNAVATSPWKSNRLIAAEIGVSYESVRRARASLEGI